MKRYLLAVLVLLALWVQSARAGGIEEGEKKANPKKIAAATQFSLVYHGKPTSMGCAPFAVSYLTSLMKHPLSAQAILDANAAQGTFTRQGMSPSYTHDELAQVGFVATDFYGTIPAVPFLAVVRMHGGSHSVVITSMSGGITFFDPWDGQVHLYSQDSFVSIWPCKCGMTIK